MGQGVDVRFASGSDLKAVKADIGQIEQVIMNIALNARDAMPDGGKLTLETANVSFDLESVRRYPELRPGDYVMLAISDTGTGMTEEVRARVFDPFFSTKGVGQGIGLGLSTCYGIIKQSSGHISVYSELARGTTYKVYLPQVDHKAARPAAPLASNDLSCGICPSTSPSSSTAKSTLSGLAYRPPISPYRPGSPPIPLCHRLEIKTVNHGNPKRVYLSFAW
jgi:hypothetical protein